MNRQLGLFDVLYVDSFAGGGGASTGIELATGHPIDIAINHDQSAILMHKRNHPYTEHYQEDIWMIDPQKATRGRPVRLAWFSPDCKHFSRAKGAALIDRHIRGLAWVVLRWAGTVHPDIIMLENVPEFVTWGPVRKGKPVKSKAGQTYAKWRQQLEALGYKIETKELCAADYGAPTIRTRFCLIARRDGQPIVFPERTHAPRDSAEVKNGKCKPWRAAAEIIDWTLPCPSIFDSKEVIKEQYGIKAVRPLKDNTLQRIARGLDKFVIRNAEPFIVECNHDNDRTRSADKPLNTVTAKYTGGIVKPLLSPCTFSNTGGSTGAPATEPVYTIRTAGGQVLTTPTLIQYHGETSKNEVRGQALERPLLCVDASNRYGLMSPYLHKYFTGADGAEVKEPLPTVTAIDHNSVSAAYFTEWYGNARDGIDIVRPLQTITAKDREALTLAHIAEFKGKDIGQNSDSPLRTITAGGGQFAAVKTTVVKYSGQPDLHYWAQVRTMLNKYCGYSIADDEVLLLLIRGAWYYISDIGLRMLTPRELYDAMGFPHDYIIDVDVTGKPISRSDQVARCGNAVCPAIAEAMTRANLPECPKNKFKTMDSLYEAMSS